MAKVWGIMATSLLLMACSYTNHHETFREASFELCETETTLYSVNDDGRTRIKCADGSKFTLLHARSLSVMRDINFDYCDGEGLAMFNESSKYYSFKCKSGTLISINKTRP